MKYKEWTLWIKSLPWSFKWFPLLILIRPIIDNFYYLKNLSPFLSPLYWVGILSALIATVVIIKKRRIGKCSLDKAFTWFAISIIFSVILIFASTGFTFLFFNFFLKLTAPIYIFFFLRRLIRRKVDFIGICTTYFYSMLSVLLLFLYELFVNPIRIEYRLEGVARIQGNFGDVSSYGFYLNMALIILVFLYIRNNKQYQKWVILTILMGSIALIKLNHVATFVVFIAIIMLTYLYLIRKIASKNFFLMLIILIIGYVFFTLYTEDINKLFEYDLYAASNEIEKVGHGRVGRLINLSQLWMNSSFFQKMIGFPVTFDGIYVGLYGASSTHNDFLRILFLTGIVGLFFYLNLLFVFYKRHKINLSEKYLSTAILSFLVLYSMTLTPTIYFPVLYIVLSIFAYFSLPIKYRGDNV